MFQYHAEVLRVVDGDTLDLRVDLGFKVDARVRVRLAGIDTPETFGVKHGSEEYVAGKAAREFVEKWLGEAFTNEKNPNGTFLIKSHDAKALGTGKYGRWIVDLYRYVSASTSGNLDPRSLNEALLEAGHAEAVSYG